MMEDDGGEDEKILAVPHQKITRFYEKVHNYSDLPDILVERIVHFFSHYKDMEPNKWTKVRGVEGVEKARELIMQARARYKPDS